MKVYKNQNSKLHMAGIHLSHARNLVEECRNLNLPQIINATLEIDIKTIDNIRHHLKQIIAELDKF